MNNEHISTALRALAKKNVEVAFQLSNRLDAQFAENIVTLPELDSLAETRKIADEAAAFVRFHNVQIHKKHSPQGKEQAEVFDALEKTRTEILLAKKYSGVFQNISTSKKFSDSVSETFAKVFWNKSLGFGSESKTLLEKWIKINAEDDFAQMLSNENNQENFAKAVKNLIAKLENSNQEELPENMQQMEGEEESESQEQSHEQQEQNQQQEFEEAPDDEAEGAEQSEEKEQKKLKGKNQQSSANNGLHNSGVAAQAEYKIYNNDFDEVVTALKLASFAELGRLRAQLDAKINSLSTITHRLSARLQQLLMAPKPVWWELDQEDGNLDSSRYARLIANPNYNNIYKFQKVADQRDTVVTLLIDNSGSMRGRPIVAAIACADILAKVLEQCGVKVEILGFTTAEWRGGKSRQKWLKSGTPKNPGRLNDLRHIIYKSADAPWRRAKRNLGLALKDGLLKENIDGEAILWANSRLASRPEKRKILMVISDGAPVDDSTISTNPTNYLDNHLREIISHIENKKAIELLAIGIGHDVGRYYKNAVTIMDINDLGETMVSKMEELFAAAA